MTSAQKRNVCKISSLVAMLVLVAVMTAMLSACGLFSSLQKITSASIEVTGLEQIEGGYQAQRGESFELKAKWSSSFVSSPTIQWFLQIDDGNKQEIDDATSKTLIYTISDEMTYKFSVVVGEVESEQIVVTAVYATLNNVAISSSSHQIAQGVIQQNLDGVLEDVTLVASWNDEHLDPDVAVDVKWFVDEVEQGNTTNTFIYDVSSVSSQKDVEVKLVVTQGDLSKDATLTLSFVLQYAMVDSVSISVDSLLGQPIVASIGDFTYLQLVDNSSQTTKVSLGVNVLPQNTNLSNACVWEFETSTKTEQGLDTSREIERTLSYGKNVVYATVDNVKSARVTIYVLDEILYNAEKTHIDDRFVWYGNVYDHYISSQADVSALVGYTVSLHKPCTSKDDDGAQSIYIANSAWKSGNATTDAFAEAIGIANDDGVDESGKFPFSFSVETFYLSATDGDGNPAVLGTPRGACVTTYDPVQANNYVRYSEVSTKRTSLPIDEKNAVEVRDSNDLFRNVSNGYQPIFGLDEKGETLSALYEKARGVLLKYIDEDMSELDKVKVIYDWIVNEVEYDYAAAESNLDDDSTYNYNAFYLEGVFNDKRAVCDGKSKAFALLCGMEGIRSMRIVGRVSGSGHAWNKVLVDANGDGEREWYVVDTTWGDASDGSKTCTEYLTYKYFLITDADIASTHTSTMLQPIANTAYNAYAHEAVTIFGHTYTFEVATRTQLEALVAYSSQNGGVMLAIKKHSSVTWSPGSGYLTLDEDKGLYCVYAI